MVTWSGTKCRVKEDKPKNGKKKKDGVKLVVMVDKKESGPTFHQQLCCTSDCACCVKDMAGINPRLQCPNRVELHTRRIFLHRNRTRRPRNELGVILEPFHHKWRSSFKDGSEEDGGLRNRNLRLGLRHEPGRH